MSCMSGSTRESGTTESTVRRLGLVAGVCVVGIWVLGAVAAPLAPYRADEQRLLEAFQPPSVRQDRKSTRLNSSHGYISYAVFCLKKKKKKNKDVDIRDVWWLTTSVHAY